MYKVGTIDCSVRGECGGGRNNGRKRRRGERKGQKNKIKIKNGGEKGK
jgi:hypothetical protein